MRARLPWTFRDKRKSWRTLAHQQSKVAQVSHSGCNPSRWGHSLQKKFSSMALVKKQASPNSHTEVLQNKKIIEQMGLRETERIGMDSLTETFLTILLIVRAARKLSRLPTQGRRRLISSKGMLQTRTATLEHHTVAMKQVSRKASQTRKRLQILWTQTNSNSILCPHTRSSSRESRPWLNTAEIRIK